MDRSEGHATFMREMAAWEEAMQKKDTQLKNSLHATDSKESPIRKASNVTINPTQFITDKKALAGLPAKSPATKESTTAPITITSKPVEKAAPQAPQAKPTPQTTTVPIQAKQSPVSQTKLSDSLRSQLDQDASDEKEKGNAAFKAGQFREAITRYTNALMITPANSVLYSNRAMALLKLQDWDSAEKDCTAALLYDTKNVKALMRRATARKSLKRYADALADTEAALEIEPGNKELHDEARALRTLVKSTASSNTTAAPSTTSAPSPATAKPSAAATSPSPAILTPSKKTATSDQTPAAAKKSTPEPTAPSSTASPQNKAKISELSEAQRAKPAASTVALAKEPTPTKKSPSAAPVRRLIIKPKVPENAPQTSFEFEKEWHSLRSEPSCLHQYWKLIDPASYGTLFSSGFSPESFSDVLTILKNFYLPTDVEGAFRVIQCLTKVDRIEVLVGFMSEDEKSTVRKILEEAKKKNKTGTDIEAVRARYL